MQKDERGELPVIDAEFEVVRAPKAKAPWGRVITTAFYVATTAVLAYSEAPKNPEFAAILVVVSALYWPIFTALSWIAQVRPAAAEELDLYEQQVRARWRRGARD